MSQVQGREIPPDEVRTDPCRPVVERPGRHLGACHMRGLRIGTVALAALVFVFLDQPTGVTILIIAAALLVVLG